MPKLKSVKPTGTAQSSSYYTSPSFLRGAQRGSYYMTEKYVDYLRIRYPVGTWFTLPINYTVQVGAKLLIVGSLKEWVKDKTWTMDFEILSYNADNTRTHYPTFWVKRELDIQETTNPFAIDMTLASLYVVPEDEKQYWVPYSREN